ncbi:MAG: recombinase zinc beta ribbon domain-containing protein, partial [Pseudomonadota bacterium]
QHQRQKNAEQVVNRMKARMQAGYYVHAAMIGYRYQKRYGHGKLLVRDEPNASIIQEGLEGYAAGRFQTAAEFARFLESHPSVPQGKSGSIHRQRAFDILRSPLYCGHITKEAWGIHFVHGKHEPLISVATWQKIQDRLDGNANAPARQDLNQDFPLRGAVLCGSCNHPYTAAWSKGRSKRYPYYSCQTRGCAMRGKSIRAETIETGFADLLRSITPAKPVLAVAKDMLNDLWRAQLQNQARLRAQAAKQLKAIDRKIESAMARLLGTDSAVLVSAYEDQIKKLEIEKARAKELVSQHQPPKPGALEQTYRTALSFLANPWILWENGDLHHKRLVLRLTFTRPLTYDRNRGYRTAETTLPFKALGGNSIKNSR